MVLPPEAPSWASVAILDDIAAALCLTRKEMERWEARSIEEFYSEGICGGAIVPRSTTGLDREVIVPMAHQSAMAGIMLATQFAIAADPELRKHRSEQVEARLNVLAGLPQQVAWPRRRTPGCICADEDYQTFWRTLAR